MRGRPTAEQSVLNRIAAGDLNFFKDLLAKAEEAKKVAEMPVGDVCFTDVTDSQVAEIAALTLEVRNVTGREVTSNTPRTYGEAVALIDALENVLPKKEYNVQGGGKRQQQRTFTIKDPNSAITPAQFAKLIQLGLTPVEAGSLNKGAASIRIGELLAGTTVNEPADPVF